MNPSTVSTVTHNSSKLFHLFKTFVLTIFFLFGPTHARSTVCICGLLWCKWTHAKNLLSQSSICFYQILISLFSFLMLSISEIETHNFTEIQKNMTPNVITEIFWKCYFCFNRTSNMITNNWFHLAVRKTFTSLTAYLKHRYQLINCYILSYIEFANCS